VSLIDLNFLSFFRYFPTVKVRQVIVLGCHRLYGSDDLEREYRE